MLKVIKKPAWCLIVLSILTCLCLASCTADTSQSQSSTTSGQQTNNQPSQQQSGQPGQSQPPGSMDMTEVLNRAAEILGISADEFVAAFQNAMPSGPAGQQGGEPPARPESEGGEPPARPEGQEGDLPGPSGNQQRFNSESMTEIYEAMAQQLNITADDIASAISQAQEELK